MDFVLKFPARGKFYGRLVCLLVVRWFPRVSISFNITVMEIKATVDRYSKTSNNPYKVEILLIVEP